MADFADIASDQQQFFNDQALSHRRPVHVLKPTGECHNPLCGLELDNSNALFCGAACAQEHDRHG